MIVGNPKQVLGQSEPRRFHIGGPNVLDLKGAQERHLFNIATQEFALLISLEGELKASSLRLLARLPEAVKLGLSAEDGGRHRSAAEISASADCVASWSIAGMGRLKWMLDSRRVSVNHRVF